MGFETMTFCDTSQSAVLYQLSFESCSGLNFFQALISQLLNIKLCVTVIINHVFMKKVLLISLEFEET